MFEDVMGYMYPAEMTPWRTPRGPASDARILAMARQWAEHGPEGEGGITTLKLSALKESDRQRFLAATRTPPTEAPEDQ